MAFNTRSPRNFQHNTTVYGSQRWYPVTISHGNNIYRNFQLITLPGTQQRYLAPLSSFRHEIENLGHYQNSPSPRIIGQQLLSAPYYSIDEVLILQNGPARHYSNFSFHREDNLTSSMAPTKVDVSDEMIEANLEIKNYKTSASSLPSEVSSSDEDHDICVVCQDEFESQEKVGALRCGHGYHVDCIKRWLRNKTCAPFAKLRPFPYRVKS